MKKVAHMYMRATFRALESSAIRQLSMYKYKEYHYSNARSRELPSIDYAHGQQ